MILKVLAVYDTKTEHFGPPFFQQTTGEAIRSWTQEVNNPESMVSKHPLDFSLHELGTYDDSNGVFTNSTAPLNLGNGTQFKKQPDSQANLFSKAGA